VYGVDVVNKELLPPISINSESVSAIAWDGKNNQLLITGIFPDHSAAIITFPYDGTQSSVTLLNLTASGIPAPFANFLDWQNGVYYLAYSNKTEFYVSSFSISSPTKIQSRTLGCGSVAIDFLFLDSTTGALFGIGYDTIAKAFTYYSSLNSKCTTKPLGLSGIVVAATYDPTARVLRLGYVDNSGNAMVTFDLATATVASRVPTLFVLSDIQASYAV